MKKTFFSICIPVYNMAGTIGLSIESVMLQTCDDWELVIVDDCSTDGTWELLCKEYASHSKISLHRNDKNLKLWGNLNRCLELAKGEWVGFLPADDSYRLDTLQTVKDKVYGQENCILWAHAHICHGVGVMTNIVPVYTKEMHFKANKLAELLYKKGNIMGELSSYLFKREVAQNHFIRFRDCVTAEDFDFWVHLLRAMPQKEAIYWPNIQASVLQHPNAASAAMNSSKKALRRFLFSIGELGSIGWPLHIVIYQYLRILKFFIYRYHEIPGNKWGDLAINITSIKLAK